MMSSGINRRAFVAGVAGTSVAALSAEKLAGQETKPVHSEKKTRPAKLHCCFNLLLLALSGRQ